MLRYAIGNNKKKPNELSIVKRRARDSLSSQGNIFLKYAAFMIDGDDANKKGNQNDGFLYGNKQGMYKYISLEMLPCGDQFRNKHHMQYDPTADWHVPVNDVFYQTRKKTVHRNPAAPVKHTRKDVAPEKMKEVFQMRRLTDRRKSMNPKGIYERPPMNPNPKGMYNGYGRKPTFLAPPLESSSEEEEEEEEEEQEQEERAPIKRRVKDLFKGSGAKKTSIFMALKFEDLKRRRSSFNSPPTPPKKVESSSSSEAGQKPQKLVKRRVKDKLKSGSTSSRGSIFIKWERNMEDDEDPCSREPLFEYVGEGGDSSEEPVKRVKANCEKYAICYRKHNEIANVCLACEKDETYGLFTERLKKEPWKLPRGRPDPRTTMVKVTPADNKKKEDGPHSRRPVCYMFDHEVEHTYFAKKAVQTALEKAKMRKHLSKALEEFRSHLYRPVADPAAVSKT